MVVWMEQAVPQGPKAWEPAEPVFPQAILKNMNLRVDPCNDFFRFACRQADGRVGRTGELADLDQTSVWDAIHVHNQERLHSFLEADKGLPGQYYQSCMNIKAIKNISATPLPPLVHVVKQVHDKPTLVAAVAELQALNIPAFFDWQVLTDPTDPTRHVFRVIPGGWTLPNYQFYTEPE